MAKLIRLAPEPEPRTAGWLVPGHNCTELGYRIVVRAFRDLGIEEAPWGSNRGIRIDSLTRRSGLNPPQWWCALWVGGVYADCGALIPRNYPGTDYWLPFIDQRVEPGAAILYGLRRRGPVMPNMDAHHIGIVVRVKPLETIEGNRSWAGTASNNGVAVDIGPVQRRDILGYFHPVAAKGTEPVVNLRVRA